MDARARVSWGRLAGAGLHAALLDSMLRKGTVDDAM